MDDKQLITSFTEDFQRAEQEIYRHFVGHAGLVRNVLAAIVAGGNVLLEGLPGLGKTRLVNLMGKILGLDFSRIQFTPDLMPGDVTGTDIFVKTETTGGFEFRKGPVFCNILLADEINRATPKTQSALLEAMQERQVTVGGNSYRLPAPFFVLATQNPLEMEGTYPLPEAQLDRFMLKLKVDFPTRDELYKIVGLTTSGDEQEAEHVLSGERLLEMGAIAKQVPVSEAVGEYAVELVLRTHPETEASPELAKKYLRYGSSPRGAQSLISIAKVYALLDGRYNVAFDDVKKAALPALRHRVFLNFEAVADGMTEDNIISAIL